MDPKANWNSIIISLLSKKYEGKDINAETVLMIDEERDKILKETIDKFNFLKEQKTYSPLPM